MGDIEKRYADVPAEKIFEKMVCAEIEKAAELEPDGLITTGFRRFFVRPDDRTKTVPTSVQLSS